MCFFIGETAFSSPMIANLKIFHLSTTLCECSASRVYMEMVLNMSHNLYIARPGCGISSAQALAAAEKGDVVCLAWW